MTFIASILINPLLPEQFHLLLDLTRAPKLLNGLPGVLHAGVIYLHPDGGRYHLSHSVLYLHALPEYKDIAPQRWDIFLPEGGLGVNEERALNPAITSITLDQDRPIYEQRLYLIKRTLAPDNALKDKPLKPPSARREAIREHRMSQHNARLGIHYQLVSDSTHCYLHMNFIEGTPLDLLYVHNTYKMVETLQAILRDIPEQLNTPVLDKKTQQKRTLIHRDIHAGNIMIKDNHAVLLDYNLAKIADPAGCYSTRSVRHNSALLTPRQIEAKSKGAPMHYTRESDLYALALTMARWVLFNSTKDVNNPYVHEEPQLIIEKIVQCTPANSQFRIISILKEMLDPVPIKRLPPEKALQKFDTLLAELQPVAVRDWIKPTRSVFSSFKEDALYGTLCEEGLAAYLDESRRVWNKDQSARDGCLAQFEQWDYSTFDAYPFNTLDALILRNNLIEQKFDKQSIFYFLNRHITSSNAIYEKTPTEWKGIVSRFLNHLPIPMAEDNQVLLQKLFFSFVKQKNEVEAQCRQYPELFSLWEQECVALKQALHSGNYQQVFVLFEKNSDLHAWLLAINQISVMPGKIWGDKITIDLSDSMALYIKPASITTWFQQKERIQLLHRAYTCLLKLKDLQPISMTLLPDLLQSPFLPDIEPEKLNEIIQKATEQTRRLEIKKWMEQPPHPRLQDSYQLQWDACNNTNDPQQLHAFWQRLAIMKGFFARIKMLTDIFIRRYKNHPGNLNIALLRIAQNPSFHLMQQIMDIPESSWKNPERVRLLESGLNFLIMQKATDEQIVQEFIRFYANYKNYSPYTDVSRGSSKTEFFTPKPVPASQEELLGSTPVVPPSQEGLLGPTPVVSPSQNIQQERTPLSLEPEPVAPSKAVKSRFCCWAGL